MTSRRKSDSTFKARHQHALDRPELRDSTAPRVSPAGPTSAAMKVVDPETRRMIDEAVRGFPWRRR